MEETTDRLHGLLPHIVGLTPPLQFAQVLSACSRQFSLSWYLTLHEQRPVVVPDDAPSINAAINRLGQPGSGASNGHGLVLVRPGTYAESVRVTRNCYLLGLGGRGKVVVEAPGWESALVFSGLGVRSFGSGEDACVANITFRCRNELMRGRCVYIVLGQPTLECCDICGGVQVAGRNTAPDLRRCRVQGSWGSGLHLTDHCRGALRESTVAGNRRHGVLVDRGAQPCVVQNRIAANDACGIRLFCGDSPGSGSTGKLDMQSMRSRISDNELVRNTGGGLSLTPRYADAEELRVDSDGGDYSPEPPLERSQQERNAAESEEEAFAVFAPVGPEDINWPRQ